MRSAIRWFKCKLKPPKNMKPTKYETKNTKLIMKNMKQNKKRKCNTKNTRQKGITYETDEN